MSFLRNATVSKQNLLSHRTTVVVNQIV